MTASVCTGSAVVVGEVAAGCGDLAGVPEQPVVPDAGGEGEQALADAGPDAFWDVAAVVFEGELAFERVVGRRRAMQSDAAEAADGNLVHDGSSDGAMRALP
jgi:hypothetical protein